MEHHHAGAFGSLTGDHSDLFLAVNNTEESKSNNLEPENRHSGAYSRWSSRGSGINDFSILTYNDKDEHANGSGSDTSSEIYATSVKSWSNSSFNQIDEASFHDECNPIVRKMLIIGVKHINDREFKKPIIIASYPDSKHKKDHTHYHNLIYWVFPDKVCPEIFSVEENKSKLFTNNFVHMILNDDKGVKTYWTFLKFKELFLTDGGLPLIVPKSICLISDEWLFNTQRQFLSLIFKNVIFK